MLNKIIVSLFLLVLFGCVAKADMAPGAGETRVHNSLTVEAQDDFSDYRFFVGDHVDEIRLEKGKTVEINPVGAWWCSVYAIPKKALAGYGDSLSDRERDAVATMIEDQRRAMIDDRRRAGSFWLFDHTFSKVVPQAQANMVYVDKYHLERDKTGGIKAILDSETNNITEDDATPVPPAHTYTSVTPVSG